MKNELLLTTGGEPGSSGQHHHRVQDCEAGPGEGQRLDRPHQDASHNTGGQDFNILIMILLYVECL